MSVLLDSRPHAKVVRTLLTDAADWTAYDYGKVPGSDGNPGTLPPIYALVSVERRFNSNLRMSAQAGRIGWRLAVRVVGRTPDEARWALMTVAGVLNESRLALLTSTGPRHTTPIQFESEQSPEKDDGRYSALSIWVYAL